MIFRSLLLISLSFLYVNFLFAEEVCPGCDKLPAPSGANELKMLENEFNFDHALKSTQFLEKDVIEILKNHTGSHSVLSYEGFYISYPNSVIFVKGTLMRQEALIAKSKLEVAKLKFKNGKVPIIPGR